MNTKQLSLALVAFIITACGTEERTPYGTSRPSSQSKIESSANSQVMASSEAQFASHNLLSESSAKLAIEKAESKVQIEAKQSIEASPSSQKNFMSQVNIEVEAAFCSAKAKNGKQLSKEQCVALSSSFMLVIEAASTKDAGKTAKAWNGFIQSAQKMNKAARATGPANGGLIADILGLAVDAIGLVIDLIAAVLALDVAGVVNVALDAVNLVIDFLV